MESYRKGVLQHEGKTLTYYKAITDAQDSSAELTFADISLKDVLRNMSQVFVAILTETLSGQVRTYSDFVDLFFKDGRPIYIGLLIMCIAFCIYIVDITS